MHHKPHAEMQPILAEMLSVPMPDYTKMPIAEARAMFDRNAANWNRPMPEMPARDLVLGGVRCRRLGAGSGLIVFVHGGGWTFGSPASHERCARLMSQASGMEVLLVDYRLAPEHACPAAIDDVLAVLAALPDRPVALFGDSAGANIALAVALAGGQASMLSLAYGCFAPLFDTGSHKDLGDGKFGLTTARMRWFWDNWQGAARDPRAVPLDGNLSGLPPVHLLAAGLDCLRDDFLLAERLANADVAVRLDVVPGVVHGFLNMSSRLSPAHDAIVSIGAEISKHAHGGKQR